MRRRYGFLLQPKWIAFHLLVVGGIVAMINLGFWQLRRLDERQAFNATIEQRYDAPPMGLDELLGEAAQAAPDDEVFDEIEWRPVEVSGAYEPAGELRIVNRSQDGRAGDNIVTPLRLDDDRVVYINRGFLPLSIETVPGTPTGDVTLTGRIRTTQERQRGQLSDPDDGVLTLAQRVDLERLATQVDGELVPVYVDLIDSNPTSRTDGLPQPVAKPDLSEGNHLSYAVQWYIFAAAVAVGWVLAVRRSAATHRSAEAHRHPTSVVDDAEHHVADRSG